MRTEEELQALREENRLLKALVAELLPLREEVARLKEQVKELHERLAYETSILVDTLDAVFLEKFLERVQSIDPKQFSDWEDWVEKRHQSQQNTQNTIKKLIVEAQKQRQETMDILDDPDIPKTKQMKIDYAHKIAGLYTYQTSLFAGQR